MIDHGNENICSSNPDRSILVQQSISDNTQETIGDKVGVETRAGRCLEIFGDCATLLNKAYSVLFLLDILVWIIDDTEELL